MRFLWQISGVHDLYVSVAVLYSLPEMEQAVLCTEYMLQYGLFSCAGDREADRRGRKYRNTARTSDTGAGRIPEQVQKMQ